MRPKPNLFQDTEGQTALIKAVVSIPEIRTRTKMVEMIVDRGGNTDIQDNQGKTALYYACESRANELVKILSSYYNTPYYILLFDLVTGICLQSKEVWTPTCQTTRDARPS